MRCVVVSVIRQEFRSPCRRPPPISLGLVLGYPRAAIDMGSRFSSCSRAGTQRRGGRCAPPATPNPKGALRAPCSVQGPRPRKFNEELIEEEGVEEKENNTWSLLVFASCLSKKSRTRADWGLFSPVPILDISEVSWLGLASPTGCTSNNCIVGTRNLESEMAGGNFPSACRGNLETELTGACKPHGMQV